MGDQLAATRAPETKSADEPGVLTLLGLGAGIAVWLGALHPSIPELIAAALLVGAGAVMGQAYAVRGRLESGEAPSLPRRPLTGCASSATPKASGS